MRTEMEKWLLAYKLKALIFLKRDDEIALRLASRPLKVEVLHELLIGAKLTTLDDLELEG